MATSNFNSFVSDFNNVNIIDNPTYKQARSYDRNYWLISNTFFLRKGETKDLTVFLKTAGEQFGDAITPVDFASYTFKIIVYDQNGNICLKEIANGTDGKIIYSFKELDFSVTGRYFAEIEITNGQNVFTLPTSNSRIQIIVN